MSDIPGQHQFLERVMGIEPTSSAWKAEVLPLNYTRSCCLPEAKNYLNYVRTPPDLAVLQTRTGGRTLAIKTRATSI